MTTNFGAKTLALLAAQAEAAADRHAAQVGPIVAEAVATLATRLDAVMAEMRAALVPQSVLPPVAVAPTPDPAPTASRCVVTVISAAGVSWRWDATAAAKRDTLGLRAMRELLAVQQEATADLPDADPSKIAAAQAVEWWNGAAVYRRDHPVLRQAQQALTLSDPTVDVLFRAAAAIKDSV